MQWNGESRFEFDGKPMKFETRTFSDFPNLCWAIAEQILPSAEKNKSKKAGLWQSLSGI